MENVQGRPQGLQWDALESTGFSRPEPSLSSFQAQLLGAQS